MGNTHFNFQCVETLSFVEQYSLYTRFVLCRPVISRLVSDYKVEMGKPIRGARVRDRISALPDALVCHILSCLPTVDAVRTTVLSTRWNRKWTLVPNLDFYEVNWKSCARFMTFVDRVLFFRDSSEIQQLCLDCSDPDIDFARVDSWICTAIWRNVVELDLCVDLAGYPRTFELPRILFTSKTLQVLRLSSNFITRPPPPPAVYFPSLKVLFVDVHFPRDDNTPLEKLFSNCPLLEQLTIEGALGTGKVIDINISASELKMLKIRLFLEDDDMDDQYHFSINAPKLENCDLYMNDLSAFSFEINANSHFKVNIEFNRYHEEQHDDRIALLEAISNVKHLSLTTPVTQGILPAFDNLNHLELALIGSNCWGFLYKFLKSSPNLEYLVIKQFTQDYEFNPPEVVPVCMLSHLKAITIKGFEGKQFEMMVAKYLLKHCEVLNKMTIFTRSTGSASLPNAEEKALYKEFLMFERGSKSCQVEIFN